MPLPTIQDLRRQRPEFDQYGYSDLDIVDWMHGRYNGGGTGNVADTARAMGMELPDSDFANSWQQGWNNLQSKLLALGRATVEDPNDPFRAQQAVPGLWNPQGGPNIETMPNEPGSTAKLNAYLRQTKQLLQEGIDLERANLAQNTQDIARFNTNPQNWDQVKFGDPEKGVTDYMSHLLGVSGPEMAATVVPGVGVAGLTGRAGLGGLAAFGSGLPIGVGTMAGEQQDTQGYTDMSTALPAGAAYSALNLLGPEAGLIGRFSGAMAPLKNRLATSAYQGVVGAAGEVVGEVGQEGLELAVTGQDLTSPEAMARYKEAAIGAALLGGPISAATGATVSQQQPQIQQDTNFQPPGFPAFDPTQAQPVPVPQAGQPIMGPPAPARFDPEQIAQAIPVEEITLETVPTEGIQVQELNFEEVTVSPVEDTTAKRLPSNLTDTAPITDAETTLSIDNVGQSMADLARQNPDIKYTNADLDWANRNLVGKTVDEITAIDTRSPKRQALMQEIVDSAPQVNAVSPDPTVPTTGIELEVIEPTNVVAPRSTSEKVINAVKRSLTARQNEVLSELQANPNATDTDVAAALAESTGKKVSRQSIANTKKAMRRKLEQAAKEFGLTVEEIETMVGQTGAATRAAEGAPVQADMTQAELSPEALAGDTSALGVVQSPGGAQGNIAETDQATVPVTTFGEDFNDARVQQIPSGYQWLAQNDPDSPVAQREASKFWTAERKGMEDAMPPFRALSDAQKRQFVGAMRQSVVDGDTRAMIEAANQIVAEVQAPPQEKVSRETPAQEYQAPQPISQETTVAGRIWMSTTNELDSRWKDLTERQREIFQLEVENLANKPGLTEAAVERNIAEIKKRVALDGGAYYEGMYRRVKTDRGSQASQVMGWTKKFRESLGEWVRVDVVQSVSDLPARADGKKHPGDIAGSFVDGQVYLVADNIGNKKQALETVAHEVVGHLGMENMLGEAVFNDLLGEVNRLVNESDPSVQGIVDMIRATYTDRNGNYVLTPRDEAREILAHLAQRNPKHSIIRKLIAKLRMALAKLGLGSMPAAQLEMLVVESGTHVRTQLSATPDVTAQPAYSRSPLEEYHDNWQNNQGKQGTLKEVVERAAAGNEKFAKSRGKYRQLMEATMKKYKDADNFRNFVATHAGRVNDINKRLRDANRSSATFQPFQVTGQNIADVYTAQGLIEFFTQGNKSELQADKITPLAANIVYGADPTDIVQFAIAFHIDQKMGGYDGLIGTIESSESGTDFSIAAEQDIGDLQAKTIISWQNQLSGVQLSKVSPDKDLPANTFDFVVKGPDVGNVDFRDQWVDNAKDGNFELYKHASKDPEAPGTVAPGFFHYVRWKGLQDRKAMMDLGKIAMRAQAVVQPDLRPPNLYSVRTTGANQGKETYQTQDRVEHMYQRRAEANQFGIQNRMADEIRRGYEAFKQRVGPELLNLKGLVDVYGSKLPTLRTYYKTLGRMERAQTHLAAEAQAIATKWNTLKDADNLNALASEATMEQIHPDVPFTDDLNKHLDKGKRVIHAKLSNKYNALSPEAQEVYQLARDKMRSDWDRRGQLYSKVVGLAYADAIENETDQAKKNKLIEQRDKAVAEHAKKLNEMKGPYFPLMRFGKYIAIYKSPRLQELEEQAIQSSGIARTELTKEIDAKKKDSEHYVVKAFETQTAMDRFVEQQPQEGWYAKLADPSDPKMKDITKLGMDKVKDYLSKNVDGKTRASIETMLAELYVGTLPENHALARELRRQGIEGAETNMLRSFAQATEKMSFYLSRFEYRDQISEHLQDIKAESIDADTGTDVTAQQIYQQVLKRYKADLDHHETPIQNAIARISGLYHLASPAYWFVNSTQPWIIGAPYAAARLGGMSKVLPEMRKAFGESYKLIKDTVSNDGALSPLNVNTVKNEGERNMLNYLIDHGRIDINITAELGALAQSGVTNIDKISNLAMWPAHQVETSNRLTLALAVWRLARKQGMAPDKALQLVDDTIVDTQIDYSNVNAPYLMKTGVTPMGKLIFQFRKYQHSMVQLLALQSRAALKGDKQARATLGYLVGMQVAIGGGVSIPGTAAVFALSDMFIDDDDEDGDAETQMRNALADWVGPEAAKVIWKGLPAGVGMDLSKRTGMGDIFSPLPFLHTDGNTGEEVLGNIAVNTLGAWTSIPKGVIDSYKFFDQGDIWRGLESAIPLKGIRDLSKGIRYSTNGMTTRSQNIGISPDGFNAWEILQRSMGLSPLQETEYYAARSARARTEEAINDVRGQLLRDYSFAVMAGDRAGIRTMMEAINAFNLDHPEFRVNGAARRSAYKNRRKYNQVDEQGNAQLPFGQQKLRDLTRFAD